MQAARADYQDETAKPAPSLVSNGVTTRQRTERAYKDLMSVLHQCQVQGWLKDALPRQPKIESIHAKLMQAIPEDGTSEADLSGLFE